jgi:hypothetical protein
MLPLVVLVETAALAVVALPVVPAVVVELVRLAVLLLAGHVVIRCLWFVGHGLIRAGTKV